MKVYSFRKNIGFDNLLFLLLFLLWGRGEVLAMSRFYDADQLSSNLITTVCQDRQGYIWIGTEYGLNKFDGVRFTQYYNDDTDNQSLCGDHIRRLLVDKDGTLWVVCGSGVGRYVPSDNSFERVDFGGAIADVTDILQTPDGDIWLLNSGRGIFMIDKGQMKASRIENISKAVGNTTGGLMFLDTKSRLWIGNANENRLIVCDTKTRKAWVYEKQLGGKNATGIFEDEKNLVTVFF